MTLTPFCSLCGSTNPADLGKVIGICLDATACHQRQYARLRDRADAATARAEAAEAQLAAIRVMCQKQAEPHDREFGKGVRSREIRVCVEDILAIIGSEEDGSHA